MSNSVPAVLTGLPKQQRNTYVSWPAPEVIRKHKDFWTHGDVELGWNSDVLYFKLTHVISTDNMFDKGKPDRVAHYQQVTKPEYEAAVATQKAVAVEHAKLLEMQQAEKTAQYKQQYAQQLMQSKGPTGMNPWWGTQSPKGEADASPWLSGLVNVTSAPTQPQAVLLPPKPEPPPELPNPEPSSEPSVPDPIVPKRRMMKA